MNKYIVTRNYGNLKKGDEFVFNNGLYTLDKETVNDYGDFRTIISMDENSMKRLLHDKIVVSSKKENDENPTNGLTKVADYVNELIDTYTKDFDNLMSEYTDGKVQECVKVEANTVYYNMLKLLNTIKDKIDEQISQKC